MRDNCDKIVIYYLNKWLGITSDGSFQFTLHNHYGFLFLHTFPLEIAFMHKCALFINSTLKYLDLLPRNVWSLSVMLTLKWCQNWLKKDIFLHQSVTWEFLSGMQEYKNLSRVQVRIEKSIRGSLFGITRLSRVMPNSDPEGRIFPSAANSHDNFFFLHTFLSPAFDFNIVITINESCWRPPYWNLTSYVASQWRQLPTS